MLAKSPEPSAEQKSANEKTVLEFASDKTGVEIMDELTYRSDETYSYAEALAEAEEFISLIESQG